MDLEPNTEQRELLLGLNGLLRRHREIPQSYRADYYYYDYHLRESLQSNGYFDVLRSPGYGSLEAALVLNEIARLPAVIEAAASLLVAPQLLPDSEPRPVALISGNFMLPQRFLHQAEIALIEEYDDILVVDLSAAEVEPTTSIYGYPFGQFRAAPDTSKATNLAGAGPIFRKWRRVALAVEAAAAMQAALDFTVLYVKDRNVFGRPVGSFQVVQHRLAKNAQVARNLLLMALRAAWSGEPADAALAAAYGQRSIPRAVFDFHQFNGALGMTTEHALHLWTMRLRVLQSELGGADQSAISAARATWP